MDHEPWSMVQDHINRKEYMKVSAKKLKPEWQPGGSRRSELLEKAVDYLLNKKLPMTQSHRHYFLVNQLGLSETEYLECLNKATNGELVRNLWN